MLSLLLAGPPGWVLKGASVDMDFVNGRTYAKSGAGGFTSLLSCTRASTADYVANSAGLYTTVAANTLRMSDLGLLVEQGATNLALRSRAMTFSTWVKTTLTAGVNQVGIDGAASSASLLTATAGNGMALQTVTAGSAAYAYSVFLKRVSGTGTINITIDGVTWTPVVLTANYQRFSVTQTVLNPVIGVQIVTNGDSIAADFSQLETGPFATSPIVTLAATSTRSADIVSLTGAALTAALAAASAYSQTFGMTGIVTNGRVISYSGGLFFGANTTTTLQISDAVHTAQATIPNSGTILGLSNASWGWDSVSAVVAVNGSSANTGFAVTTNTGTVSLGSNSLGTRAINGYLQRLAFGLAKTGFG